MRARTDAGLAAARCFLLVALLAGLACGSPRSERSSESAASTPGFVAENASAWVRDLDRDMPNLLERGSIEGASLAVVEDGRLVLAKGYGVRDRKTGAPVGPDTVFEAASLSKPVFAHAVLRLVERGDLDLDRPLARIVPSNAASHDPRHARVTARMVLTHTSGIAGMRDDRLVFEREPGSGFRYSGDAFFLAQEAVERIAGVPLHEFLGTEVFSPLGMTRSSFVWEDRFESDHAVGHLPDGAVDPKKKPKRGHAGATLHTTASDYARFLMATMRGEGLAAESRTAMLSRQVEVAPGVAWGLGWGLEDRPGGLELWHWGHFGGYRAYTSASLEARRALVLLTNSANGMTIAHAVLSRMVPEPHPGLAWQDYERFDSPARIVRLRFEEALASRPVEEAIAEFRRLAAEHPPEALDERLLNRVGYRLLAKENVEAAVAVFRLNVERYPDAWNPHDSLGEAYLAAGDRMRAIESYRRSLELNPQNDNAARVLRELGAAR